MTDLLQNTQKTDHADTTKLPLIHTQGGFNTNCILRAAAICFRLDALFRSADVSFDKEVKIIVNCVSSDQENSLQK
jgi:hypothetical protein